MAIERANSESEDYSDGTQEMPEPEESEETIDVPFSMLGGQTVKPGDVIRLEAVSVNEDAGTVTAKYATGKPKPSSISAAASKFEA